MASSLSGKLDKQPLIWRVLYHPMFAISLVLHTFVLFLPLSSEPEPPLEEEVEDVDVIQLDALIQAPPEPSPSPVAPTPKPATPTPVAPTAAAPPAPRPAAPPPPQADPTPSSSPSQVDNVVATPAEVEPVAPTDVEQPFDPTPSRGIFVEGLTQAPGALPFPPGPTALESDRRPLLFNGRDPVAGVAEMKLLNDVQWENGEPQVRDESGDRTRLLEKLQETYQAQGFTFEPVEPGYAGGLLYEMQDSEGQTIAYVNFVPGIGGAGGPGAGGSASTILVVWEYNPNAGPPEPTAHQDGTGDS